MAETEVERLTQKQRMKSRAAEECGKFQLEGLAIAEKLKDLEQRAQCPAAVLGDLWDGQHKVHKLSAPQRRATLSVQKAARGSEGASSSPTNFFDPVE